MPVSAPVRLPLQPPPVSPTLSLPSLTMTASMAIVALLSTPTSLSTTLHGRTALVLMLVATVGQSSAVFGSDDLDEHNAGEWPQLDAMLATLMSVPWLANNRRYARTLVRLHARSRVHYARVHRHRQAGLAITPFTPPSVQIRASTLIARTWRRFTSTKAATKASRSRALYRIMQSELADAIVMASDPIDQHTLIGRQSARTVRHRLTREVRNLAWVTLCYVPRAKWIVLSYLYRLRAGAQRTIEKRRAQDRQRLAIRELYTSRPKPIASYDVGVDRNGGLLYRSSSGTVKAVHPSMSPLDTIPLECVVSQDGLNTELLQPPSGSSFDICPDTSGAMCYINRNNGEAQWEAPPGSTALTERPLIASLLPALPKFPTGLGYGALQHTQWHPLYQDHIGRVVLYNAETGAIREGPWICLRTAAYGMVYFANLITQDVRWFPPRGWMEAWISRPNRTPAGDMRDVVFDGHRLSQYLLPMALARQRVECGAPPSLYERGLPQYAPDEEDTPNTHPACLIYPDHYQA